MTKPIAIDVPADWIEPVIRQGERAGRDGAGPEMNPCAETGGFHRHWEEGRRRGAEAARKDKSKPRRRL